jgi:hypothetical protein
VDIPGRDARVAGIVAGSPIVQGRVFFAYEHPYSQSAVEKGVGDLRALSGLQLEKPLPPGQLLPQSWSIGVVPSGQLRRGFLYYIERERAHPHRPFLHYNSWYDICWSQIKIREDECLAVIGAFGRDLVEKRGVHLDSLVWDDGWDDPRALWRIPKENFPNGFTNMLAAAHKYNSALGVWMSPFGGYGKPKADRLVVGKAEGFETGPEGFSLAGPKYYARFLETTLNMVENNRVNFFKFDGLARGIDETQAMMELIRTLRERKPNLFVSITTGTWPSPFWLWHGDSTWRGGGDMGWEGPGTKREQWMTYRDTETYRNVVQRAPLYPLNALMNQGFAHARHGYASELGNSSEEIRKELRSFFACGTCLQELYVTPGMMTAENWDDLAEAAKWGRANADVLADTHWVGGDPGKGEAYGWASWSEGKGILALRNPAPDPLTIKLEIGESFELPAGAAKRYNLQSPWKEDAQQPGIEVQAGSPHTFKLTPFEVQVFEAIPVK